MYRKLITLAVIAASIIVHSAVYQGRAEASHTFNVIAVRDVQAYRHLLENDDRLFLIQYALAESPTEPEAAYGPTGAILKLMDGSTVVRQASPPTAGYAVAAMYFTAAESVSISWADVNIEVCIEGNPTLFASPQSHCGNSENTPTWNSTSDSDETADELVADLPVMLQSIELDDPDVDARDYVTGAGITQPGQALIENALPVLVTIASQAFAISQGSAGGEYNPATPVPGGLGETITNSGPNTSFAIDLQNLGATFGLNFWIMGGLLVLVSFIALWLAIRAISGDPAALVLFGGPVLLTWGMIGAPPFLFAVAMCGLAFALGVGFIIKRSIPS